MISPFHFGCTSPETGANQPIILGLVPLLEKLCQFDCERQAKRMTGSGRDKTHITYDLSHVSFRVIDVFSVVHKKN